jgi:hypothetical protein
MPRDSNFGFQVRSEESMRFGAWLGWCKRYFTSVHDHCLQFSTTTTIRHRIPLSLHNTCVTILRYTTPAMSRARIDCNFAPFTFWHAKKEVDLKTRLALEPRLRIWIRLSMPSVISKFYYLSFPHPLQIQTTPTINPSTPLLIPVISTTHPTPETHSDIFNLIQNSYKAQSRSISTPVVDLNV